MDEHDLPDLDSDFTLPYVPSFSARQVFFVSSEQYIFSLHQVFCT